MILTPCKSLGWPTTILSLLWLLVLLNSSNNVNCWKSNKDCPRGRCDDGRCPQTMWERCPEDGCFDGDRRCGNSLLCVDGELRSCPGEPCTTFERSCADGSCVQIYQSCPDGSEPCLSTHRRCKNGKCHLEGNRCAEDPCDALSPHKCNGECHSKNEICDGRTDCPLAMVESLKCPASKLWYLLLLLIIPLSCCVCCAYYCYKSSRVQEDYNKINKAPFQQQQINSNDGTQMYSHVAQTVVLSNNPQSGGFQVRYQTTAPHGNQDHFNQPSAPEFSDLKEPPPGYNDYITNREMYPPPQGTYRA